MKTNMVTIGDMEMEYFSFGSGKKAFVILPGVSTRSVMLSAMTIQSAYQPFAEEYTVYVFDRRRNMPDHYPVREMAADTAAVMRWLGIEDADIFGASQGGMMAMCLGIDSPELVHKLVLGSTAACIDAKVTQEIESWITLAKSGEMTALTAELINALYSDGFIKQYKDFLIHMNDDLTAYDLRRFIIQTEALNGFDITDELDRISCPALVIGSKGDKLLPAEQSCRIAERLDCQLYLYGEEYAHCVFDEAPDYKQRLLDFFHQ